MLTTPGFLVSDIASPDNDVVVVQQADELGVRQGRPGE